jgi:hypothetical protein
MIKIDSFNDSVRRSVCFAMAAAIVAFSLTIGAVSADAAFIDAYANFIPSGHVSVVQLASL